MPEAIRDIPGPARWALGLHTAWGLFLVLGYPFLGESVEVAKPVMIAAWFGTTVMLAIYTLVVAAGGWRRNEARYLLALLIFDAAAVAIVIELLRVG